MPVNFNSPSLPPTLRGMASVDKYGIPRFWATIWIDVLKPTMESATRPKHLTAVDRLYEACNRQRGRDCLDCLIAEADADGLENVLLGFLAQLRNEAVITGFDKASTWTSAVSFVIDMLGYTGNASGARAAEMEAKLLRLDVLYRQLAPNPESTEGPVIRALPSTVVQDLYEIFRPDSARNPFKTETLRWRNLVIFMLLLRLGLRRGEAALLYVDSFKEDFNYDTGEMDHWLDVEETHDGAQSENYSLVARCVTASVVAARFCKRFLTLLAGDRVRTSVRPLITAQRPLAGMVICGLDPIPIPSW